MAFARHEPLPETISWDLSCPRWAVRSTGSQGSQASPHDVEQNATSTGLEQTDMGSHTRGSTYQEGGPGEHLSGLSFLLGAVEVIIVRQEVPTGDAEGLVWSRPGLAVSLPHLQALSIAVRPSCLC